MTVLAEGAEATITRENGTLIKERHEKDYRHPVLDERLRMERTEREARLLQKAYQAGVRVPTVDDVTDATLTIEHIDGDLVKHVLEDDPALCSVIGESIARLHNRDIIHGDLTTSNMILHDNEVYFIDFGLGSFSQRIEDRAVDLHLLKETLESTHTAIADDAMKNILAAYGEHAAQADAVMDRYEEIAGRGRYR